MQTDILHDNDLVVILDSDLSTGIYEVVGQSLKDMVHEIYAIKLINEPTSIIQRIHISSLRLATENEIKLGKRIDQSPITHSHSLEVIHLLLPNGRYADVYLKEEVDEYIQELQSKC